jgi:hypothetical protein
MRRFLPILLAAISTTAQPIHAQSLENIRAAYVPESNYKRFRCEELLQKRGEAQQELSFLAERLERLHSRYLVDVLALGLPLATNRGDTVWAETRLEHEISHAKGALISICLALARKRCGQ